MKHETEFNPDMAIGALQHYSNSTGVPSLLIDHTGKTLYSTDKDNKLCLLCSKPACGSGIGAGCQNVHLYGGYQAERFGGKYIFFCPFGMVHWASPITFDGIMKGAVLGGPVHMIEPEEFLLADFFGRSFQGETLAQAIALSKKLPIVNPERVNSLSELLRMVACQLSDATWHQYSLEQQQQEQNADISEYIHQLKEEVGEGIEITPYPLEKEKELVGAIVLGDKPQSQRLLNEILGHIFFSSGNHFEVIRSRILELIVLLSRASLEGGADIKQVFGLNYQYLNQLQQIHSLEELTPWLSRIMERFTDYVFNLTNVKHKDVIFKAIDYIRKNYMKKLTLDEVASHVFLSPSYFSKVFKEEMEMNFNNYLNHIRIEMSKKLLSDPSITMVDVSNIVGFEDQSYFTKVFKKMTGKTPKKYRESRGKD